MNRTIRTSLCLALTATLLAGCGDWLTGPGISDNPNVPTVASRDMLLTGVMVGQTTTQTGALSRATTMWVQQFAGTDRQYISLDIYSITEDDFTTEFSSHYWGGGLVDIRQIQDASEAANDPVYLGVGQVWEALTIGTAASVWGDIPYSEAVTGGIDTPNLDPQEQVYAQVQAVLDDAIANLAVGTGGPGVSDLIYGGNPQAWSEAAHTLKARYYMHWAQAQLRGNPAAQTACGGNCLELARDATMDGISTPANDFRMYAAPTPGQENIWHQFMFRERDSYMRAGATLVNLLQARGDPRLEEWLAPVAGTNDFVGAPPAGTPAASMLNPLTRGGAGFRQPVVTWGENILLRAEAEFLLGNPGPAQTALNTYRQGIGMGTVSPSGTGLLEQIYEEMYLALFQNIEAWNMYKRSCYPNIDMPAQAQLSHVPRRLYYGTGERNANPNIPAPGTYPLYTTFDHTGGILTTLRGETCIGMQTGNP